MKKRLLAILLAVAMLLTILPEAVLADDDAMSGTCGDKLTWSLNEEGTLTISGEGAMEDYTSETSGYAPWYSSRSSIKSLVIEDDVTTIGKYAFYDLDSLASVAIGNSVTSIRSYAFEFCSSLTSVIIGNSVTIIGDRVFYDCDSLASIEIPKSLETAGDYPFGDCDNLKSVTFEEGTSEIVALLFRGCTSLENIEIPDTVTTINSYAFADCTALYAVEFPDSVTTISNSVFEGCINLKSITLPKYLEYLSTEAFGGCIALTEIEIPKSLKSAGLSGSRSTVDDDWSWHGPFADCANLKTITFEEGTTKIVSNLFTGCNGLVSITIPKTITNIGSGAFRSCSNLTDVYYLGTKAEWDSITICDENDCLTNASIHYHEHSWDIGVISTAATCLTDGLKTYTCSTCGETKTELITSLGHDYQFVSWSGWQNVDGNGWEAVYHAKCSRCSGTTTMTAVPVITEDSSGNITYTATVGDSSFTRTVQKTYTVTLNGNVKGAYTYGDIVTLITDDKSDWYLGDIKDDNLVCAGSTTYKFVIVSDISVNTEVSAADAKPVVTLTAPARIDKGSGKSRMEYTVNWTVPGGYTFVSSGLYRAYGVDSNATLADLTTKNVFNLNVANGTYKYNINIGAASTKKSIGAIAYLTYRNNTTGQTETIYTPLLWQAAGFDN